MATNILSLDELRQATQKGKVIVEFYNDLGEIMTGAGSLFNDIAVRSQTEPSNDITFLTVDLGQFPELREENQVETTPLFKAYHDGRDVEEKAGMSAPIIHLYNELRNL